MKNRLHTCTQKPFWPWQVSKPYLAIPTTPVSLLFLLCLFTSPVVGKSGENVRYAEVPAIGTAQHAPIILICPPNITINCNESTLPSNTGSATATDMCAGSLVITHADVTVAASCPLLYQIHRTWSATDACDNAATCLQVISLRDITAPAITCPANTTIECHESTLPSFTGFVTATDNCTAADIIFIDYINIEPAVAPEVRWVYLPPGTVAENCISESDCSTGQLCFGLQYIPGVSGTLNSYTSGFLLDCVNGDNPVTYNASCVMTDNSDTFDICVSFGDIFMNCSGNTGSLPVTRLVPVILHQVCVQLAPGESTLIDEDEITNITTTIGDTTEMPSYYNYTVSYDNFCLNACNYPYTIYRQFIVTDTCSNLSTCVQMIEVEDNTAPIFDCPSNVTLAWGSDTSVAIVGEAFAYDNCDLFPEISFDEIVTSGNCEQIFSIQRTWTAIDICGNESTCVQLITINDEGTICGEVTDDLDQPLGNITLVLYADINGNQQVDGGDTIVATTLSAIADGAYCFTGIRPCQYVVREEQPLTYGQASDYDTTPDPDGDDSTDGPDDEIPVTLGQSENDVDNHFIDIICPTAIPQLPNDTICQGQSVEFEIEDMALGMLTYGWSFGEGATPGTGTGLGPHVVTYDTTAGNQLNGADVILTISKDGCPDLTGQVADIIINPYPDPSINAPLEDICYYTNRIFQPQAPQIPGAAYAWNFGTGAVPAAATGYGPHNVQYTTAGLKTVKLVIHPNAAGAQCPDSSTVSFTVITCAGQIYGFVKSDSGAPIVNANVRLYADPDMDGDQDGSFIKNVFTNQDGFYSMATITPGNYVIVETQPTGWFSFDDYDDSNDNDIVPNTSMTDNIIPATILPGELDSVNYFIETAIPGTISGNVFADNDGDMLPDAGEGLADVVIHLYTDADTNGVADNGTPVFSTITNANGIYSIASIPVGQYVLVEIANPVNYISVKDYDSTPDGDLVPNTDMDNDTIPVSITNNETDANNYFIDAQECTRLVTNLLDDGFGSLRYNIACAQSGDTIRFHSSLAGQTIMITSTMLILDKDLVFLSTLSPTVKIASSVDGLFNIYPGAICEFRDLYFISGISPGNTGAAFDNLGTLTLHNCTIMRNPSFPDGNYLIRNKTGSTIILSGYVNVETE